MSSRSCTSPTTTGVISGRRAIAHPVASCAGPGRAGPLSHVAAVPPTRCPRPPGAGPARPPGLRLPAGPRARGARHPARGPFPEGVVTSTSASAASGARRSASGGCPASTRPPSATRAASRRTRRTRRSAPDAPGTRRTSSSSTTPSGRADVRPAQGVLGEPRPDPGLPPGQRRRHAVPLRALLDDRTSSRRWSSAAPAAYDEVLARRASTRSPPSSLRRRGEVVLPFYYAEAYHQQYLYKIPHGYDCHAETGILLPDLG